MPAGECSHAMLIQRIVLDTRHRIPYPSTPYTPAAAAKFFREHLVQHCAHEMYMGLHLDARGVMGGFVYLGYGHGNWVASRVDEAVAIPFIVRTRKFVLVHNHVDNALRPSSQDMRMTAKVKAAAQAVGKYLVDDLIVGNDYGWVSMRDKGLL